MVHSRNSEMSSYSDSAVCKHLLFFSTVSTGLLNAAVAFYVIVFAHADHIFLSALSATFTFFLIFCPWSSLLDTHFKLKWHNLH